MKFVSSLIILVITIASFSLLSVAQQPQPNAEVEIAQPNEEGYRRDGIAIANLEALLNTTKEKAFVIAHLGRGETVRQLNRRRLECISNQFGPNVKADKVILAEGDRVKGLGRIDFYVGSELMHVALIARNGNLCHR
jgi:hypothetical protein